MKIKFNPVFFVIVVVLPLLAGVLLIPYALFISATPYYFAFPFGSFWQEYIIVLLLLDLPLVAMMSYMAVPYIEVINAGNIVFYRLRRNKLTINLKDIERVVFIYGRLPPPKNAIALNMRIYLKDEDVIIISGIGRTMAKEIKKLLERDGVEWTNREGKLFASSEEEKRYRKRGY